MRYKLNNEIIENGTYVLTKDALWLWCAKNSNWIYQPIVSLDLMEFNEIIKSQISEKIDLLDFDKIIEEYLK